MNESSAAENRPPSAPLGAAAGATRPTGFPAALPAGRRALRLRRLAAPVALGAVTLALAVGAVTVVGTGTAWAKSNVSVGVSSHVVRLGQTVQVSGSGADDSVRTGYLCLDERAPGTRNWRQLACARNEFQTVRAHSRAGRRGTELFRARLMARYRRNGPLVLDRLSPAAQVLVR